MPAGTLTESFNKHPENVRAAQKDLGDGRLNDWMEGDKIYKVTEEVLGLGAYGRTLTVLTCNGLTMRIEEIEEEDEEEALVKNWTPGSIVSICEQTYSKSLPRFDRSATRPQDFSP